MWEAGESLKRILEDSTTYTASGDFEKLRNKMNQPDLSNEEKLMIVDRFKAIFSYIILLTESASNQ